MKTKPIHLYRDYMIERYGDPLFRIPVDLGQGCPHRDEMDRGGCTFCPEHGARAVQTRSVESVGDQVDAAILFARNRYRAKRYMLYFQAFSSTARFNEEMCSVYRQLLSERKYDAVSIGTRPDCLGDQVLSFLKELQHKTEVWIELGVQTVHDKTLRRINRGHDWASTKSAIERLHDAGICVAAHVILGLPGENQSHANQTAETLAELPVDAVKIHNLHVIRGTALAAEYAQEPFDVYGEYDYAEMLMNFIRRTPWSRPIIRMTTDTPVNDLIAPVWQMSKGAFREYVQRQMVFRQWRQGDLCGDSIDVAKTHELENVVTEDGSVTFWNAEYREHYHTPAGARLEAKEKYVDPARLSERLSRGDVRLLDICFGLGYNTLSACNLVEKCTRNRLVVTALEMDRRVVEKASEQVLTLDRDLFDWHACLCDLHKKSGWESSSCDIEMVWGDARYRVQQLEREAYDVVFLDAFSTQRNSELWTLDFFRQVRAVMAPGSVLVTYCAALPVRAGLLEAGFYIGETAPVGRKRSGTMAAMSREDVLLEIADMEWDALRHSERGIPYRDPYLCWSNSEILRTRQDQVVKRKRES